MSEVSGGPGWWQASDGRWYPPESYPPGWPPPPGAGEVGGPDPRGPDPRGPGSPQPGPYGQAPSPYFGSPPPFPPPARTNGLAIAALVCSILWGFGVLSVVAIVLGLVARSQIRRTREGGNGLALAGIIVGGVGIVGAVVSVALLAAVGTYIDEEFNSDAHIRLTAEAEVCWRVEISNFDSDLDRMFDGCGPATFDLGRGIGRKAAVTKVSGAGPIIAELLVEGENRANNVVLAQYDTVELSP